MARIDLNVSVVVEPHNIERVTEVFKNFAEMIYEHTLYDAEVLTATIEGKHHIGVKAIAHEGLRDNLVSLGNQLKQMLNYMTHREVNVDLTAVKE